MDNTKKILQERIIDLYQKHNAFPGEYLALRYEGVAARLNTEWEETKKVLWELVHSGIMFMRQGYFALNPSHLWKPTESNKN